MAGARDPKMKEVIFLTWQHVYISLPLSLPPSLPPSLGGGLPRQEYGYHRVDGRAGREWPAGTTRRSLYV